MIQTKRIIYNEADNTFEGFVAWDSTTTAKRPVVLISHAFSGQLQFEENKAVELAKLGYIGFAIDIYGKGIRGKTRDESKRLMDALDADRKTLLKRMQLSVKTAKELQFADSTKIGAIGFCFGGKCVLDLARSGDTISGVVSFHGLYDAPEFNKDTKINTPILVLHGWDDPLAPPKDIVMLGKELTSKSAPWELNAYGHTGHAFTNPKANTPENGLVYNKDSNTKGWNRMKVFFETAFTKT